MAQERFCHFRADHVRADVISAGVAATIAKEAGERVIRAGHEWITQNIERHGQFAPGALTFSKLIAVPIKAETSPMLPGTIIVLLVFASCA